MLQIVGFCVKVVTRFNCDTEVVMGWGGGCSVRCAGWEGWVV